MSFYVIIAPHKIHQRRVVALRNIAILACVAFVLHLCMLNNGHNWGGDFSQYIAQAMAIVNGGVQEQIANNTFMMQNCAWLFGPYVYPWGYPILLTIPYMFFGFSLVGFKLVNVVCFSVFVGFFYCFCVRYMTQRAAFLTTAIFAFNPTFLYFNINHVLSDTTFLLFSFAALFYLSFFFTDTTDSKKTRLHMLLYSILGGIFMFLACLTRSNGIVIPMALFCAQALLIFKALFPNSSISCALLSRFSNNASLIAHILPYIILLCGMWLTKHFLYSLGGEGHGDTLSSVGIMSLVSNFFYYIRVFRDIFGAFSFIKYALLVALFFFMYHGLKAVWRDNILLIIFVIGSLLALIIWPHRQGFRFVLFLMPFYIFWASIGIISYLPKHKKYIHYGLGIIFLVFLATNIFYIAKNAYELIGSAANQHNAFRLEARQAYQEVINQTKKDDIIVFFKPRVLYLNAKRLSYATMSLQDLLKADYLLDYTAESAGQLFGDTPQKLTNIFEVVYRNNEFVFYKIHKDALQLHLDNSKEE